MNKNEIENWVEWIPSMVVMSKKFNNLEKINLLKTLIKLSEDKIKTLDRNYEVIK